MRKTLTAILAALGFSLGTTAQNIFENVDVNHFEQFVRSDSVQLVDVRTPKEYAEGHIVGAVNINVKDSAFLTAALSRLDKERPCLLPFGEAFCTCRLASCQERLCCHQSSGWNRCLDRSEEGDYKRISERPFRDLCKIPFFSNSTIDYGELHLTIRYNVSYESFVEVSFCKNPWESLIDRQFSCRLDCIDGRKWQYQLTHFPLSQILSYYITIK